MENMRVSEADVERAPQAIVDILTEIETEDSLLVRDIELIKASLDEAWKKRRVLETKWTTIMQLIQIYEDEQPSAESTPRIRRNLREEALRVLREHNGKAHQDTVAKALELKVRDLMPSLRYLVDTKRIAIDRDGICELVLDGPVPARKAAPLPGLEVE